MEEDQPMPDTGRSAEQLLADAQEELEYLDRHEPSIDDIDKSHYRLKSQYQALVQSLNQLAVGQEALAEQRTLQDRNKANARRIVDLETEIAPLRAQTNEVEKLREKTEYQEFIIRKLRQAEDDGSTIRQLATQQIDINSDNQTKIQSMEEKVAQYNGLHANYLKATDDAKTLRTRNEETRKQLEVQKKNNEALQKSYDEMRKEKQSSDQRIRELEARVESKAQENQQLQNELTVATTTVTNLEGETKQLRWFHDQYSQKLDRVLPDMKNGIDAIWDELTATPDDQWTYKNVMNDWLAHDRPPMEELTEKIGPLMESNRQVLDLLNSKITIETSPRRSKRRESGASVPPSPGAGSFSPWHGTPEGATRRTSVRTQASATGQSNPNSPSPRTEAFGSGIPGPTASRPKAHDTSAFGSVDSPAQPPQDTTVEPAVPAFRTRRQTGTSLGSQTESPSVPSQSRPAASTNVTPSRGGRGRPQNARGAGSSNQRSVDDVLSHVSNRDELPQDAVVYLQGQFESGAAALCRLNAARFSKAMIESANGNVCVQQKANNRSAATIAGHGACDACVSARRICFQKNDIHPVVVVPLPETLRVGKEADEVGYWVQGR
ncbi:hypothetical protein KCU93_g5895, partial [Aureobasidium melanogenum]